MWKPTVAIMLILGCAEETLGDRRREENGDMDWRNNGGMDWRNNGGGEDGWRRDGGGRRSSRTRDDISDSDSVPEDESKRIGRRREGRRGKYINQPFIYNISIAKQFNRSPVSDVHEDELVDNFKTILSLQPLLQTRFQDDRFSPPGSSAVQGTRFSPLEIATSAGCEPELKTVEVEVENLTDTSFYYPTCTRLFRCGGCCSHPLLSCVPSDTKTENKAVIIIDMLTGEDTRQTVQMVQHLACTCGCTIQPSDCTQLQDYVAEDCKCTCKRREVCTPDKTWDSSTCKCTCIQQEGECTTGLFYSTSSCRCERAFKRLERKSTSRPPYNSNRNPDSYWKSRREELEQQDIN